VGIKHFSKVDLAPQYGQLGGCCELMAVDGRNHSCCLSCHTGILCNMYDQICLQQHARLTNTVFSTPTLSCCWLPQAAGAYEMKHLPCCFGAGSSQHLTHALHVYDAAVPAAAAFNLEYFTEVHDLS
jgi:hypothetical protein